MLDRSEMTTLCATQHRRTQPGPPKKASRLPGPGTTPNICKHGQEGKNGQAPGTSLKDMKR